MENDTFYDYMKELDKIYNNLTYFDLYSGSFFLFILLTLIVFLAFAYSSVMSNVNDIKNDWINQRCNPKVIPFAGFINKPDDKTIFDFTNENFQYCVQDILKNISGYFIEPFNYLLSALTDVFNDINNSISSIRQFISNIRNDIENVTKEVLGRLLNVMTPIQIMFISIKDSFGKIQGILTTALMTSLGSYLTLQSLMGSILQFVILVLVALSIVIVGLWASLVSWPIAAATTVIFLSISIPLAILIVFMKDVLKVHTSMSIPKVPKKPSCFDEDTKIKLNNGSIKKIKDLIINDILINNNKITAILKLNSKNEDMYKLNDIIVSGSHIVNYNNKWIKVCNHPFSKKIQYKKPYLYCLNTQNKTITINDTLFCDWDELYGENIEKVIKLLNVINDYKIGNLENINNYIDCGFDGDTLILMKNRETKKIKDIEIDDVLHDNIIVYGLVQINLENNIKDKNFKRFNYSFHIDNISNLKTITKNFYNVDNLRKSYHLLTNRGIFRSEKTFFFDYNYSLDNIHYFK